MLRAPVRQQDTEPSPFEVLSGALLDGTSLDDALNVKALIERHAEFGGCNADRDVEAWLAGQEV